MGAVKSKKAKVLISTSKEIFNNMLLKRKRVEKAYGTNSKFRKHMSKTQVGKKLGLSTGQICRYESSSSASRQLPKLGTFKKICIMFQVDPKDFLGLAWVDGELVDENGVLYLDSEKEFRTEYDICPHCKRIIINNLSSEENYAKKAKQKKAKKIAKDQINTRFGYR